MPIHQPLQHLRCSRRPPSPASSARHTPGSMRARCTAAAGGATVPYCTRPSHPPGRAAPLHTASARPSTCTPPRPPAASPPPTGDLGHYCTAPPPRTSHTKASSIALTYGHPPCRHAFSSRHANRKLYGNASCAEDRPYSPAIVPLPRYAIQPTAVNPRCQYQNCSNCAVLASKCQLIGSDSTAWYTLALQANASSCTSRGR